MTFILRVLGPVASAVLISNGVSTPVGIAIGAACNSLGNLAANEFQKREAQARLDQQVREDQARSKEIHCKFNKQLPSLAFEACRRNEFQNFAHILRAMDNRQIEDLGLSPISCCSTAATQDQVFTMIQEELKRRNLYLFQ